MTHIHPRSSGRARAAVGAAALLFGTSGVATRLLAPDLPAATAAGWRVVIGGGLLVLISVVAGQPPWRFSLRRWSIVIGALAFLGFQLGFFLAIGRLGVATATVVSIGTGPIAAGLLDRMRRGTRLRGRWWVGVATAISGIAVMTGANGVTLVPVGVASAVAAGCCFPVFGDAIRVLLADRPPLTAIATVFGAAILPAVVLLAAAGADPVGTPGTITALLYLGVVTTTMAYLLWSTGLVTLSLRDTVTLTMLEPVAATVLAVAVLHEAVGPATAVGIVAALAGVWIAIAPGRTIPSKPSDQTQPASSAAHGGFAPAREQVIAETLDANVSAASSPSTVSVPSRPPR
jgi:DME family drug/metabolite transporter